MTGHRKDIVILVADRDIESSLKGILSRTESLGIRRISFDIFIHRRRDPGCLTGGSEYLRTFVQLYNHALGWGSRADVIIIEPELESWVWSASPEVANSIGWHGRAGELKPWLSAKGFWADDTPKPSHPKEAMEAAMREVQLTRSAAVYKRIAEKVSLNQCSDPSFLRLKKLLREWYGNR